MLTGVKPGDVLYVHYSGHGGTRKTQSSGEASGVDSTWLPLDHTTAGYIVDDDLRILLANRVPAGVTLWVTSDSCHSGTVLDLRYGYTDASFRSRSVPEHDSKEQVWVLNDQLDEEIIKYDTRGIITSSTVTENRFYSETAGDVFLISGCMDLQTSADAWVEKKSQGAMSWAFFSCLKQDISTPIKYLVRDTRGLLSLHRYTQIPVLTSGKFVNLDTPFASIMKFQ